MSWPLADPRWVERYAFDARSLAVARMVFALFLGFVVDLPELTFIAELPADLWTPPPGPMQLVTSPPSSWLMLGLIAAIEALNVLVAVGWRTRATSLALAGTLALAYGLSFGTGKVNHNLLLWMTPLFLSGQWGRAWSVDALVGRERPTVDPLPIACFALVVGFCMFSAGLAKLVGGWLDPHTPATYGHLIQNFYVAERTDWLAPAVLAIRSPLLWEALDWLTCLWEIGFLFAVLSPLWLRGFMAIAVLFHCSVWLIFNIDFSANLVAYAVFVPWIESQATEPTIDRPRAGRVLAVAVPVAVLAVLAPSPLLLLRDAVAIPRLPGAIALVVAASITAMFVARGAWRRLSSSNHQ